LGAFLLGLGFNIKMLQAFLPLPAFYALYFFGSKIKWPRVVLNSRAGIPAAGDRFAGLGRCSRPDARQQAYHRLSTDLV
jgi:hypothetical protein